MAIKIIDPKHPVRRDDRAIKRLVERTSVRMTAGSKTSRKAA